MKNIQSSTLLLLLPGLLYCLAACSPKKFDGKDGIKEDHYEGTALIRARAEYKDGMLNGKYEEFYRNGKLKFEGHNKDDKRDGSCKNFYEDGTLKSEENYSNGEKNGPARYYYPSGQLEGEVNFKNDKKDGLYKMYYPGGKLSKEFNYREGKRHGEQKIYFESGQLRSLTHYDNDRPGKGTKEFKEDGAELAQDNQIIVEEVNQLPGQDEYVLRLRLSKPGKHDKFFLAPIENQKTGQRVAVKKQGSHFEYKFYVPKGAFLKAPLEVIAETKTASGKDLVLTKKINLSVQNY